MLCSYTSLLVAWSISGLPLYLGCSSLDSLWIPGVFMGVILPWQDLNLIFVPPAIDLESSGQLPSLSASVLRIYKLLSSRKMNLKSGFTCCFRISALKILTVFKVLQ